MDKRKKKQTLQTDKAGGQNLLSHVTTDLGLFWPYRSVLTLQVCADPVEVHMHWWKGPYTDQGKTHAELKINMGKKTPNEN